jgi:hypothetical protein
MDGGDTGRTLSPGFRDCKKWTLHGSRRIAGPHRAGFRPPDRALAI